MLTPIPNQPIDFTASPIIVDCHDARIPLLAAADDVLRFQVLVEPATGPYGSALREWDPGTDWGGPGSWVSVDGGGVCAPSSAAGAYIEPIVSPFSPVVGTTYVIELDVTSITGIVGLTFGGQSLVLSMPGLQTYTLAAATTDPPRLTLTNASSRICVLRVSLYEVLAPALGCSVVVDIIDASDDSVVGTVSTESRPELFTLSGSNLGVALPLGDYEVPACIYLRASSACDDPITYLCSQPISVGEDCKGTIVVRACLDHDALGFSAPAMLETRLRASLVRPRWEVDSSEERWSDGTINRFYIDRQRVMDLMIQPIDQSLHPFIAALCMFDHVYLDGAEYVLDAGGSEPAYGEQTGTAAIQISVKPKRELLRRISCDAPGTGCAPSTDPQCAAPNAQVNHYYDCDGGGYFVEVIVYSAIGFLPDRINITLDGAPYDSEVWSTPTSYLFGPFPLASAIGVEITNAAEPDCDWSTSIQLPTCEGPGFGRFKTVDAASFYVILDVAAGEPEYGTLRSVGAFGLGGETVIAAGVPYYLDGSPIQQEFCFYASDDEGNPLDTLSEFSVNGSDATEVDVTQLCFLSVLDVARTFVTSLDMSGNPLLGVINAEESLVTAIIWPPGTTQAVFVDFADISALTSVPTVPVGMIGDSIQLVFSDCALDDASVTMLIEQCYASGAVNGQLFVQGGTNAALPVVGPVFDKLDELISLRGWSVVGN